MSRFVTYICLGCDDNVTDQYNNYYAACSHCGHVFKKRKKKKYKKYV